MAMTINFDQAKHERVRNLGDRRRMEKPTIAGLAAQHSAMEERMDAIAAQLAEHDKILIRGNGKPSLLEQMRTIQTFIEAEKESRKFYSRLVIGAVLTNVISLVFAAFAWFVKIYPVLETVSREFMEK